MYKLAILLIFCLTSCRHDGILPNVPETLDQRLQRTEGLTCEWLTGHDPTDDLVPDCLKIVAAWERGKARVVKIYPDATNIKMGAVQFYRPKLYWVQDKVYPLIDLLGGTNSIPYYSRGYTSPSGPILITCSYEECYEHETVHALVRLLDGERRRKDADIQADSGVAAGYPLTYFYQILCHNTPDDSVGDGPPGKRDGCVLSYSGPPRPNTGE